MAATSNQHAQLSDSTTYEEARNSAAAYLQSRLQAKDEVTDEAFEIPVVDLSPSFSSSLADRQAVADQIRKACTTSGFFYISNHGVPESARDGILHQAERFMHDLPLEKKEELHLKNNKFGLGWEPSEYTSIAGDREEKEVFNFAYEAALDRTGGDGLYRNLDGSTESSNMWPREEDLAGFYEAVKEYYGAALDLARHLFRLFALSLYLPETYFDSMTTHPGGIARLLYYPPPKNPLPNHLSNEEQIGLGAHSDYECFTILLTSTTPGLEILKPSGHWHIASHLPGAFIVNVADFLMRWTNGLYKSTVHRVVNRSSEPRYSVPFFFSVNYDTVIETLPMCVKEGEESTWKPIRAGEYILERLNATTAYGAGFKERGE
ncbi:Clavaminate synthase-like protein [Clathrospora elynae]|uniref:Clavaminate synthase-like protein n=1 Tax=Clathrospora elynae TaxID=706981 RepID=A0A6A5S6M9_9PLEO|nr:Clavaminate synthase-like protein [Clathrospora elynae]